MHDFETTYIYGNLWLLVGFFCAEMAAEDCTTVFLGLRIGIIVYTDAVGYCLLKYFWRMFCKPKIAKGTLKDS